MFRENVKFQLNISGIMEDDDLWNITFDNMTSDFTKQESSVKWSLLSLIGLILMTAFGNLLVCLAVCWERRLQNMTNYFLMSLAIADFLVAILVMPLGMLVEVYGVFPLSPSLCVVWVTSDVLMCTASIWHMCTMSMDRYFTLKYPMRYGRNKTKKMVLMKIFFVWAVSFAVSSPVCIHGFLDYSIVYSYGQCVPTLQTFVIYGSVFAFYIPLVIMIVTYVLTIKILLKNQRMMRKIERSDFRTRFDSIKTFPPQLLTSPSGDSSVISFNETNNESILMSSDCLNKSNNNLCEAVDIQDDFTSTKSDKSTKLLKRNSHSYKSLDSSSHSLCNTIKYKQDKKQTKCFLEVPSEVFFQRKRTITSAKSDSNVTTTCLSDGRGINKMCLHLSINHLDHDSKTTEWSRRFIQIEQEMDQCLKASEEDNSCDQKQKTDSSSVKDKLRYGSRPSCHSAPNSPLRGDRNFRGDKNNFNCDIDWDNKSTSSNDSDLITIRLHSKQSNKIMTIEDNHLGNVQINSCTNQNINDHSTLNNKDDKDDDFIELDNNKHQSNKGRFNIGLRQGSKFKSRFQATIKASTRPVIKHLLSKKAATNERKASKVLGIIFTVFVILWAPFFIVNILSVTCKECMTELTAKLMSVILWMGYTASLANPIIYTMFNTAFRRTFIKILTCKLKRQRSKYRDTALHSYTTMMHTDRRNTMTVLIKDDLR